MNADGTTSTGVRSLSDYAWKVLAPREFLINVAINAPLAFLVFRPAEYVPLIGWFSLYVYCGPMSVLLPFLTTFFGYMNGVLARAQGKAGKPWPAGAKWKVKALLAGVCAAVVVGVVTLAGFYLLSVAIPGLFLSRLATVTIIAVSSGVAGGVLHARAALAAETMHAKPRDNVEKQPER